MTSLAAYQRPVENINAKSADRFATLIGETLLYDFHNLQWLSTLSERLKMISEGLAYLENCQSISWQFRKRFPKFRMMSSSLLIIWSCSSMSCPWCKLSILPSLQNIINNRAHYSSLAWGGGRSVSFFSTLLYIRKQTPQILPESSPEISLGLPSVTDAIRCIAIIYNRTVEGVDDAESRPSIISPDL